MAKHIFIFEQVASHVVVIESDLPRNESEALAYNELPGSLCNHCAHEYSMAGDWTLSDDDGNDLDLSDEDDD
jgi:hypothetical protein